MKFENKLNIYSFPSTYDLMYFLNITNLNLTPKNSDVLTESAGIFHPPPPFHKTFLYDLFLLI